VLFEPLNSPENTHRHCIPALSEHATLHPAMKRTGAATHWIEVDGEALRHNLGVFRGVVSDRTQLAAVVKANAYGHGLEVVTSAISSEVDWFAVHSPEEAVELRRLGVRHPLLVMGYVPQAAMPELDADTHVVVSTPEVVGWLGEHRRHTGSAPPIHIKVETGTHRQGMPPAAIPDLCRRAAREGLSVVGLATHFANIEDTLEHDFARLQLERFNAAVETTRAALGEMPRWIHASCSAAALLFREADFTLARVGIGLYGHWPSRETQLSWILEHGRNGLGLRPALTWKALVGQLQDVPVGGTVGYGRTWSALRATRLAVLPAGYADGYPRELGNRARALVRRVAAPVVGRVCMNITMVDVTDVPDTAVGDHVVLLGRDGDREISAEELAGLAGTINYEILARLSPAIPRRLRDASAVRLNGIPT
jgi:alanine racemase